MGGKLIVQYLHSDIFARREQRVVGVCTSNDRAKHNGLVWLILEVAIPELIELRPHLLEFRFRGTDLESGIDSV